MASPAMNSVASLTTILPQTFTPYMSCVREIYNIEAPEETCFHGTAPTPCRYFHLGHPTNTAKCFPPGWKASNDSFISPAACPRKHTVACAETGGPQTIATCCPDDGSQGTYSCVKDLDNDYLATDRCVRYISPSMEFIYTTTTLGKTETTVVTTSGKEQHIYAYGVEVLWQSSDFPGPSATSAEETEAGAESQNKTNSTGSMGEHNLSTGAKAGIGIGVAVAVLSLMLGAFLLGRLHKRQPVEEPKVEKVVSRQEDSQDEAMRQKEVVQGYGGAGYQVPAPVGIHEADTPRTINEVFTQPTMSEADSRSRRIIDEADGQPIGELPSPI